MNLNNISKLFQNNATKENSENSSEIFYDNKHLYPDMPATHKEHSEPTNNLGELISLINILNSKEGFNLKSLLASPLGKNLGVDQNTLAIINMLSSTNKKAKTMSNKATLPKIDSLEKIKKD